MTINQELLKFSADQMRDASPLIALLLGSLITITAASIFNKGAQALTQIISLFSLLSAAVASYFMMDSEGVKLLFNGMMILDRYAYFFFILFSLAGIATILISDRYLNQDDMAQPEFSILIQFSVLGMMLLVCSADLISMFISLEVMSLAVYSLVAFRRNDRLSNESGLKYFILGGAASAVFLYGSALMYGSVGSVRLNEILKAATELQPTALFTIGACLLVIGFLFKIAAVPFHMWVPDVYEGAPVPVTGFMTAAVKAAVFATLVRILLQLGFGKSEWNHFQSSIYQILWWSAAATMLIGNLAALPQNNLKRLFAYSSIAHTGYLLVGVIAALKNKAVFGGTILYLVSYVIISMGAFGVLSLIAKKNDTGLNIHDLSGLSQRRPWLAAALTLFLLSMAGIPPTAGFIAKYSIFYSAIESGEIALVIFAVLCSAVSVYYYLRVVVFMYMRSPAEQGLVSRPVIAAVLAISISAILTLAMGMSPSSLIETTSGVVMAQFQ